MACRKLNVTLISAEDLEQVNWFSDMMHVYAVVWVSSDPGSRQRTPSNRRGDRNPTWNWTLRFNVPADTFARQEYLHILLRAERALGNRDVGQVHVPLSELLDAATGDGPDSLRYEVLRCTSGEPTGVLKLSYKIDGQIATPAPAPPSAYPHPSGVPTSDQPAQAYQPYAPPVVAYQPYAPRVVYPAYQPGVYPAYQPPVLYPPVVYPGYQPPVVYPPGVYRGYPSPGVYPGYQPPPQLPAVQPPRNGSVWDMIMTGFIGGVFREIGAQFLPMAFNDAGNDAGSDDAM